MAVNTYTQTVNNKIHLGGPARCLELLCSAAAGVLPGNLVERTATGCQKQSASVDFAETLFAAEDALQGKIAWSPDPTSNQFSQATNCSYSQNDMVQVIAAQPGTLINALLLAGTNYTVGTKLYPDGSGRLRGTTGSPKKLMAVVEEAIDLSASGAVDQLGVVRIV